MRFCVCMQLRHVLAGGADPNRLIRPGQSPLMAAAAHEGGQATALEMTRILLDAGADAGFVGPEGSALHAAAAAGRGEVISALIDVSSLVAACFDRNVYHTVRGSGGAKLKGGDGGGKQEAGRFVA